MAELEYFPPQGPTRSCIAPQPAILEAGQNDPSVYPAVAGGGVPYKPVDSDKRLINNQEGFPAASPNNKPVTPQAPL